MAGEARISLHDKYVLVNVKGDPLSPEEIWSTLSKAVERAIESHVDIIIHREKPVKQHASTVDFYHYAVFLSDSAFRNRLALAFPKDMHHDNLDFFGDTLINRGVKFGLFSSMKEALMWI